MKRIISCDDAIIIRSVKTEKVFNFRAFKDAVCLFTSNDNSKLILIRYFIRILIFNFLLYGFYVC